MPRIVHFDISVSEPEEAIEYYSNVIRVGDCEVGRPDGLLACYDRPGG